MKKIIILVVRALVEEQIVGTVIFFFLVKTNLLYTGTRKQLHHFRTERTRGLLWHFGTVETKNKQPSQGRQTRDKQPSQGRQTKNKQPSQGHQTKALHPPQGRQQNFSIIPRGEDRPIPEPTYHKHTMCQHNMNNKTKTKPEQ